MEPIAELARQLAAGTVTSLGLTRACLERAEDPSGVGARAFTWIDREGSLAAAAQSDRDRAAGRIASPLAGIPVSVKARFDIAGQATTAASALLRPAPPARADAEAERRAMIARAAALTGGFEAVLMPTVPITAPVIAALAADDALYGRTNLMVLRNPTVANFLDRCAISLPLAVDGLPVGLMLMGEAMADRHLFAIARGVETQLAA